MATSAGVAAHGRATRVLVALIALAFCIAAGPQLTVHAHDVPPGDPVALAALLEHVALEHGGESPVGLHVHENGVGAVHALMDAPADPRTQRPQSVLPSAPPRGEWRDWFDRLRHRPPIA